jgi:hypothetical protein
LFLADPIVSYVEKSEEGNPKTINATMAAAIPTRIKMEDFFIV